MEAEKTQVPSTDEIDEAGRTEMRAAVAGSYGDPRDVVTVETVPVPEVEPGKVLVEVWGSAVNPLDWHMITGTPRLIRPMLPRKPPTIPGADFAGVVVELGEGVEGYSPGDRVYGEANGGGFGEFLLAGPSAITLVPENVDLIHAASLPVAGLTALQGLRDWGEIRPGDRVLVNGAAGGVGTLAVQIARVLGASHVTGVCSSRNAEAVRALGADEIVDYTSEDFVEKSEKYDMLFDAVGNRSFSEMRRVLSKDGRYVMVSGPKGEWIQPIPSVLKGAIFYKLVGQPASMGRTARADSSDLSQIIAMVASGDVETVIRRTFGLDEAAGALHDQGSFHGLGKSVLVHERARR